SIHTRYVVSRARWSFSAFAMSLLGNEPAMMPNLCGELAGASSVSPEGGTDCTGVVLATRDAGSVSAAAGTLVALFTGAVFGLGLVARTVSLGSSVARGADFARGWVRPASSPVTSVSGGGAGAGDATARALVSAGWSPMSRPKPAWRASTTTSSITATASPAPWIVVLGPRRRFLVVSLLSRATSSGGIGGSWS